MGTPMLTFEEFSALRQRKSVSSGLITETESHINQKTLDSNDDTNKTDQQGQKLNFGHLMQVCYTGGRSIDVLKVAL